MVHGEIGAEGRECSPARTPLATSRAQSPFTQQYTIDFDGLSWPSRYISWHESASEVTDPRSRKTPEEGRSREGTERTPSKAVGRSKDDPGMCGRGSKPGGPA